MNFDDFLKIVLLLEEYLYDSINTIYCENFIHCYLKRPLSNHELMQLDDLFGTNYIYEDYRSIVSSFYVLEIWGVKDNE